MRLGRPLLAPMLAVASLLAVVASSVPRVSASACACRSTRWVAPRHRAPEQPLSPSSSSDDGSAERLFDETMTHLGSILRRFRAETWGQGRIAVDVLPGHEESRPAVRLGLELSPGPVRVRGTAIAPVHACPVRCGAGTGRRVTFDVGHATGDLRGMIDRVAFDLCLVPGARQGWASLRTRVAFAPGEEFPNGLFRVRARQIESFLAAQERPLLAAVRDEYRAVRRQRVGATAP